MTLIGSLAPLVCWLLYAIIVERIERVRPSLSSLMNLQRRRWVDNAVHRDSPLDAILSSNLMGSISFFASTTVLLILALFAVFGRLPALATLLSDLRPDGGFTIGQLQFHLLAVEAMFILAFLSFTLSIRQFNHFCIMLGAADHQEKSTAREIETIARVNSLGARDFNQGIRAYYFSVPMLAWFLSPWIAIGATIFIITILVYREYFSYGRTIIDKLDAKN